MMTLTPEVITTDHDGASSSDDLFIRSLRGAGLEHDVELFLQRFRTGSGRFPLVIIADSPDEALSGEAMIPALRYLARARIGVLVLSGLLPQPAGSASFAARLQDLRLFTEQWDVVGPEHWEALGHGARDSIASARIAVPAQGGASELLPRLLRLGCRKIVLLDAQGIVTAGGTPMSVVMVGEAETGPPPRLDPRQEALVRLAADLAVPAEEHDVTLSLASPINLLAELFTVRGSGTLFRPPARFDIFDAPDPREEDLCRVVEQAFGRPLRDRGFAGLAQAKVLLETRHRCAAVLMPTPLGDYMSKFAVVREAQGTGLGGELWDQICARTSRLFWRAKNGNPINNWYARVADGMIRQAPWTFFWRGIDFAEVEAACTFSTRLPEDLLEQSSF
jgi:hypothetical protein